MIHVWRSRRGESLAAPHVRTLGEVLRIEKRIRQQAAVGSPPAGDVQAGNRLGIRDAGTAVRHEGAQRHDGRYSPPTPPHTTLISPTPHPPPPAPLNNRTSGAAPSP